MLLEGSAELLVSGFQLQPPSSLATDPSSACLARPSACPFSPYPILTSPIAPVLPQVPSLILTSTPTYLVVFTSSQPSLSHHFIPFPTSPLLPILPSLRFVFSLPLTNPRPRPPAASPTFCFSLDLHSFSEGNVPLCAGLSPPGLRLQTSFSRVARALCWSEEDKPEPGFAAKLRIRHACVRAQPLQSRRLFATLWAVARQAPLSRGFSRQQHWSGLPCPPPEDLPDPGIEPSSFMTPALAGGFFTTSATWEAKFGFQRGGQRSPASQVPPRET